MKLLLLLLFPIVCAAQKIEENKVDDFTHLKIARTSWEILVRKSSMVAHVRISKVDSSLLLGFRMMSTTGAVDEGGQLLLKMDNDSVVTLRNLKYQIFCTGCGAVGFVGSSAPGLDLSFGIYKDQLNMLLSHKIVKVRIYLTSGYVEDEVKEKFGDIIRNEIKLLNSIP